MSNDTKKECNCVEKSCTNTCTKNHTCHVFWCEKCESQRCEDMRAVSSKNQNIGKPLKKCKCSSLLERIAGENRICDYHQSSQEEDWEKEFEVKCSTEFYAGYNNDGTPRWLSETILDLELKDYFRFLISSKVQQARQEEREKVMIGLTKLFDELENIDPDKSTENWRKYKFIRNNIRDFIKSIREVIN